MKDLIVWVIHTPAGTVAIISALTALFSKKGTPIHRKAGTCFTISMLIMLVSGSVAAMLKESLDEIFLGGMVIYSVFTAWLTVYHKKGETGLLETIALAWIVFIAIAAYFANPSWGDIRNPDTYSLWIGLAICFALGDLRNLLQSDLSGS
jgi:peptidoglycan/LPS O-acetylase OafA/YrhL